MAPKPMSTTSFLLPPAIVRYSPNGRISEKMKNRLLRNNRTSSYRR